MIPAVAQTLAHLLASGTSLASTEEIDFNCPRVQQNVKPGLSLYCYDLRQNFQVRESDLQAQNRITQNAQTRVAANSEPVWFDISFLVTARDYTSLGEQRLLSEALTLLLCHRLLPEELLAPTLRGYGNLSMSVSAVAPIDTATLWSALGVPLRPAVYVTVTIPFNQPRSDRATQDEKLLTKAK